MPWWLTSRHLILSVPSFVDRVKDTMKIGGAQVSPSEIEDVLLTHPDKLISDACVAGVPGGRTADEKIPRAWIVLSSAGKRLGAEQTAKLLDEWVKKNLSSYKWLKGGFEVTDTVSFHGHGAERILIVYFIDTKEPNRKAT